MEHKIKAFVRRDWKREGRVLEITKGKWIRIEDGLGGKRKDFERGIIRTEAFLFLKAFKWVQKYSREKFIINNKI